MIKDSGCRREFESGAVRDIQEGKGRCDLLPLYIIAELLDQDDVIRYIAGFMSTADDYCIQQAIKTFVKKNPSAFDGDIHTAILEVSKHYEEGCKKYGERNWQKGIPTHCYIDSGVRHYLKFLRGDTDERHDRAFIWNMLGLMWTATYKPEMDDIPYAKDPDEDIDTGDIEEI